jgi:hypothetical protein
MRAGPLGVWGAKANAGGAEDTEVRGGETNAMYAMLKRNVRNVVSWG